MANAGPGFDPLPVQTVRGGIDRCQFVRAGQPVAIEREVRFDRRRYADCAGMQVLSGCILLEALLVDGRREALFAVYPGEAFDWDALPPVTTLSALATIRVLAFRLSPAKGQPPGQADVPVSVWTRPLQRAMLRLLMLGGCSGEERLSTMLVEHALVFGTPVYKGFTFDSPMSRSTLAGYLALNPDTLSRLMSRLKERGMIAMPTRSRIIVKDFERLCAMSPFSEALRAMHEDRATGSATGHASGAVTGT